MIDMTEGWVGQTRCPAVVVVRRLVWGSPVVGWVDGC